MHKNPSILQEDFREKTGLTGLVTTEITTITESSPRVLITGDTMALMSVQPSGRKTEEGMRGITMVVVEEASRMSRCQSWSGNT